MEKKRGRGRPRVTEYLAGEQSAFYEKVITNGKQYRSRRSISDTAYTITASSILSEAASEIEDLELLFTPQYMGVPEHIKSIRSHEPNGRLQQREPLYMLRKPPYRARKMATA